MSSEHWTFPYICKYILQGKIHDMRRKERPQRRWVDDTCAWMGCSIAACTEIAKNISALRRLMLDVIAVPRLSHLKRGCGKAREKKERNGIKWNLNLFLVSSCHNWAMWLNILKPWKCVFEWYRPITYSTTMLEVVRPGLNFFDFSWAETFVQIFKSVFNLFISVNIKLKSSLRLT